MLTRDPPPVLSTGSSIIVLGLGLYTFFFFVWSVGSAARIVASTCDAMALVAGAVLGLRHKVTTDLEGPSFNYGGVQVRQGPLFSNGHLA